MPNPELSTSVHKKKSIPEPEEPQVEPTEVESPKPTKKKAPLNKKLGIDKVNSFWQNEKNRTITGLLLLVFSLILTTSFVSFFFTWKLDFDKVNDGWFNLFLNTEVQAENWLGKLGALLSHFFIYSWFGLPAFALPLLFFLLGFRVIFKTTLLPLDKTISHSVFFIFWLSTFASFIFYSVPDLLFLGGGFGFMAATYLKQSMGNAGTSLLLFFFAASYILFNFTVNLGGASAFFQNLFAKKEKSIPAEAPVIAQAADNLSSIPPVPVPVPPKKGNAFIEHEPFEEESEKQSDLPFEDEEAISEEITFDEEVPANQTIPPVAPIAAIDDDFSFEVANQEEEAVFVPPANEGDALDLDVEETPEEEILDSGEIRDLLKEFGEYDPTLELSTYKFPDINILREHGDGKIQVNREELEANKNKIVDTLKNYNIEIERIKATIGPTVTLYEIVPAKGVRISKIKSLEDDIALSLAALGIRIIAPIPGKGTIGIEVPNQNPDVVSMKTVISSEKFQNSKMDLPVAIGKTIQNEIFIADLAKMPHLLMAGATGQGKSVGLNAILVSLLYKKHPSQIKFVLVDPKKVELTLFNKIERHFLAKLPDEEEPIITDTSKVVRTLNSLCIEMDQRYDLLKIAMVRTIKEYNQKFKERKLNPENGHRYLPYIVLVVDEFADLIMTAGKEVELPIARLAQLARAIGIHLIIATQRPSVNIITGTIKANFPSRIAFRVSSKIDSRTILDAPGADQLIGRGDMLFSNGNELIRLQCPFVDTPEVEEICEYIGEQRGYPDAFLLPEYVDENAENLASIEDMERDSMFEEAARIVVIHQQGSASLLQRKLKLGYNRAGRIVDQLEHAGIIGPYEGSKARAVLIHDEASLEHLLKRTSMD